MTNPWECDDAPPTCDLKWSAQCDNLGVVDLGPERSCHACAALCDRCQEREWAWKAKDGTRSCDVCLTAAERNESAA